MAIVGIGTDIVEISRIKSVFKKYPIGFAERVLHKNELKILKRHQSPATFIAKRFSAKEAVAKALGTGISKGVSFKHIEISSNEGGQPVLILHDETLAISNKLGVKNNFISLSDEKKYAIAYVILEN